MLRRITRLTADDIRDLAQVLDGIEDRVTLIFDVDGTVARQGASPSELGGAVVAAVERFERSRCVIRAIALTNGADRGVDHMISRANKPWTTRRRLGLDRSDRTVVVGDQVLTDGLLAWRLGAVFVHLVVDTVDEPPAQARLRRLGGWLEPLLFSDAAR